MGEASDVTRGWAWLLTSHFDVGRVGYPPQDAASCSCNSLHLLYSSQTGGARDAKPLTAMHSMRGRRSCGLLIFVTRESFSLSKVTLQEAKSAVIFLKTSSSANTARTASFQEDFLFRAIFCTCMKKDRQRKEAVSIDVQVNNKGLGIFCAFQQRRFWIYE